MGGGDLLNLLIERDVFEEDFTRFYVAEVRSPMAHQITVLLTSSFPSVSTPFLRRRCSGHGLCAAQMVLAIESCHKHGFIHRDIKPDVGIDHGASTTFRLGIWNRSCSGLTADADLLHSTDRTFCLTRKDTSG